MIKITLVSLFLGSVSTLQSGLSKQLHLDDLLVEARDMERLAPPNICSCAVEAYELSDLERLPYDFEKQSTAGMANADDVTSTTLHGASHWTPGNESQINHDKNGNIGVNGSDWASALCSEQSDADFLALARSKGDTGRITRGRGVELCGNYEPGSPSMMVDDQQKCKCCPVKCGAAEGASLYASAHGNSLANRGKIHSCCGDLGAPSSPTTTKYYHNMKVKDVLNWCDKQNGYGTTFQLSMTTRFCECSCPNNVPLYDAQEQCTVTWEQNKLSTNFKTCTECTCDPPNSDKSIQSEESWCRAQLVDNHFEHKKCTCYCNNKMKVKVREAKPCCEQCGYDFRGGDECECVCKAGDYPGHLVDDAEKTCTDHFEGWHSFQGHKISNCGLGTSSAAHSTGSGSSCNGVDNGVCQCSCQQGRYRGLTLAEAEIKCGEEGGIPFPVKVGSQNIVDPCRCMCKKCSDGTASDTSLDNAESYCSEKDVSEKGALGTVANGGPGGCFVTNMCARNGATSSTSCGCLCSADYSETLPALSTLPEDSSDKTDLCRDGCGSWAGKTVQSAKDTCSAHTHNFLTIDQWTKSGNKDQDNKSCGRCACQCPAVFPKRSDGKPTMRCEAKCRCTKNMGLKHFSIDTKNCTFEDRECGKVTVNANTPASGAFEDSCQCCPPSASSFCHKDYPYIKSNTMRCMDTKREGACRTFCETAGGSFPVQSGYYVGAHSVGTLKDDFRCLCYVDNPDGNSAVPKVKKEVDLFWKKNWCENKKADFHPPSCDCVCRGETWKGMNFLDKRQECARLTGFSTSNPPHGVWEPPTCLCLCSSHEGVFHGPKCSVVDGESKCTIAQAKDDCEGTLTIDNTGGGAVCRCNALPSEPCCEDGSGELISTFKCQCNETCIVGGASQASQCKCDYSQGSHCNITGSSNAPTYCMADAEDEMSTALCTCKDSCPGSLYDGQLKQKSMADCQSKHGTWNEALCNCDNIPGGGAQGASTASGSQEQKQKQQIVAVSKGPAHLMVGQQCLHFLSGTTGQFLKVADQGGCLSDNVQIFSLTADSQVKVRSPEACLQLSSGSTGNVYMQPCENHDLQHFLYTDNKQIKSMNTHECLMYDSTTVSDAGVNVYMRTCVDGDARQVWDFKSPEGLELAPCHVANSIFKPELDQGKFSGHTKQDFPKETSGQAAGKFTPKQVYEMQTFAVELKAKLCDGASCGSGYRSPATHRSYSNGQPAGWMMYVNSDDTWVVSIGTTDKKWVNITSRHPATKNEWTKLLFSYEESSKKLKFYVNSALQGMAVLEAGQGFKIVDKIPSTNMMPKFRVGGGATEKGSDGNFYFVGEVKDVELGSTTENCEEVSALSDLEMNMVEGDLERLIDIQL